MCKVELGRVSGVFGVRGEVRLYLHNPSSFLLDGEHDVELVGPDGQVKAARLSARPGAGKRILGRIAGIEDRDSAAALMGWQIRVARRALPDLEPDEYYVWQMEGAEVQVLGRAGSLGRVVTVHQTGPIELIEIDTGTAEPLFVPSLEVFVERFDAGAGVLVLRESALGPPADEA